MSAQLNRKKPISYLLAEKGILEYRAVEMLHDAGSIRQFYKEYIQLHEAQAEHGQDPRVNARNIMRTLLSYSGRDAQQLWAKALPEDFGRVF